MASARHNPAPGRYRRLAVLIVAGVVAACGPTGPDITRPGADGAVSNVDRDGDGYSPATGDCDESNPAVHPGQTELPGNGLDDDCNGYTDADFDSDGYTTAGGDCDDADRTKHPNAPEDGGTGTGAPNGIDDDCDGTIDNHLPSTDDDGDGWTELEGDCDDDDTAVNPGAYDVPDNGVDEDCNGVADDTVLSCDQGLAIDDNDPLNAVRAIGLCHMASPGGDEWGVLSARWLSGDGQTDPAGLSNFHVGHGILPDFGNAEVAAREGERILLLSSGTARRPTDPGYEWLQGYDKGYTNNLPSGPWSFSPASPNCPSGTPATGLPQNGISLEVRLRVPTNAQSASFDFNFFTYEYPMWICSEFNDYFVALLLPQAPNQTTQNVSFDTGGNPISVNNALLQVCSPGVHNTINFDCPLGTGQLAGTGFSGHAATGWLRTTISVEPQHTNNGEITLLFAVWDSEDPFLDTTVVIDNWQWSATPANGSNTIPVVD